MRFQTLSVQWVDGTADFAPLKNVFDATLNASSKNFVVPKNETWRLLWAHVTLISTATVGNRQIEMRVLDASSNLMLSTSAGATQAASLTREYHFMNGTFRETAFVANEIQVPFPDGLHLQPGWTLNFRDLTAVDAAADDLTVAFQANRFVE